MSTLFTGASRYSSDFSSLIERAVSIASLPLSQLESSYSALENESTALGTLNTKITAVNNAISALATAASQASYSTSISNAGVLSASTAEGAAAGTYTIEVTSIGAYSTAMSLDGLNTVTDPATQNISPNSNPTYTLNGVTLTLSSNNLNALAQAINDNEELDIQATVVNIGSTSSPDYRLALQSEKLGPVAMQLSDGTQNLFSGDAPNGSLATYKINGVEATASDSRTITPAAGLTMTLIGEGTSTVTVSRTTTNISNALSSFATAYNNAVDELDNHRGSNAGALSGQVFISAVWDALRSTGQYDAGTGDFAALSDLGIEFDQEGHMSFDSTVFLDATANNHDALTEFLGSATEGGFLKFATDVMNGLQDDTDGIITTAANNVNSEIARMGDRISAEETRIETLRTNLTEQMAAADAAIATLEQEAEYISSIFEAMRIAQQSSS